MEEVKSDSSVIMDSSFDDLMSDICDLYTNNHDISIYDWLKETHEHLIHAKLDSDPVLKVLNLGSAALILNKCIRSCVNEEYTSILSPLSIIHLNVINYICLYPDKIRFDAYEFGTRIIINDLTRILFELSKADRCETRSTCIQGLVALVSRISNSFSIMDKDNLTDEIRHIISDAEYMHKYLMLNVSKIGNFDRSKELDRKLGFSIYRLIKGFNIIGSTRSYDIGLKSSDTAEKKESTTMNPYLVEVDPKEELLREIGHHLRKAVTAIQNMPGRPDLTSALVYIVEVQKKAEAGDFTKASEHVNSALDGIVHYAYKHKVNMTAILCELISTGYAIRDYLKSNGGDK